MEAETVSQNRKEKERTELFVKHISLSVSSSWNMKAQEGRLEAEAGSAIWLHHGIGFSLKRKYLVSGKLFARL